MWRYPPQTHKCITFEPLLVKFSPVNTHYAVGALLYVLLLGPLLKNRLPLIRNVLKPLAKSVLIPLGLTAAASATDAAIFSFFL